MTWFEKLMGFSERSPSQVRQHIKVTLHESTHTVTQAYCSALPIAYSDHAAELWAPFAQLVLEAAYEATLYSTILNAINTGNTRYF